MIDSPRKMCSHHRPTTNQRCCSRCGAQAAHMSQLFLLFIKPIDQSQNHNIAGGSAPTLAQSLGDTLVCKIWSIVLFLTLRSALPLLNKQAARTNSGHRIANNFTVFTRFTQIAALKTAVLSSVCGSHFSMCTPIENEESLGKYLMFCRQRFGSKSNISCHTLFWQRIKSHTPGPFHDIMSGHLCHSQHSIG